MKISSHSALGATDLVQPPRERWGEALGPPPDAAGGPRPAPRPACPPSPKLTQPLSPSQTPTGSRGCCRAPALSATLPSSDSGGRETGSPDARAEGSAPRDGTPRPGDPSGGCRLSPGTGAHLQNDRCRGFRRSERSGRQPHSRPREQRLLFESRGRSGLASTLSFLGTERPPLESGDEGLAGPRWARLPDPGLALPVAPGA